MTLFEKIAADYPVFDLESCRILLQIGATPGLSIRELADVLLMDQKRTQLKVALLAQGRKNRRSSAYGLVTNDYNLGDPRKRSLSLTAEGENLVNQLNRATVQVITLQRSKTK